MITWRAALDPDNQALEAQQMGYDASAKHVATVFKYVHQSHYQASFLYPNGEWYPSAHTTAEWARKWCERTMAAQPDTSQYTAPIIREATPAEQVTRSPFLDADREERRKKWLHLRTQAKAWKETACRLAREVAEAKADPDTDLKDIKDEMASCQKLAAYWEKQHAEATAKLQQVDANTAPLRGELDALREGAKKLRECLDAKDAELRQLRDQASGALSNMTRMQWKLADANTELFRLREDYASLKEQLNAIYRDMFGSVSGGAE